MWKEILAAHELFRRLGFRPDDIYPVVSEGSYGIKLEGAHGRVETVKLGPLPEPAGPWVETEWQEISQRWNAGEIPGDDVYGPSIARHNGLSLFLKMEQGGFRPPGGWSVPVKALADIVALTSAPN